MTQFEWVMAGIGSIVIGGGCASWMTHVSISVGKVIAELHAINDKISGQLDWLKKIDDSVDDHEKRIAKLESGVNGTCKTTRKR